MTLKSQIANHLNNICTGFWTRVILPSFKRFANVKRSTTRSKGNYRESSPKLRNGTRPSAAELHNNNAKPFGYPPSDPVGKKHAATDKGDENRFGCKATARAGTRFQCPAI